MYPAVFSSTEHIPYELSNMVGCDVDVSWFLLPLFCDLCGLTLGRGICAPLLQHGGVDLFILKK